MPIFEYKGLNKKGNNIKGTVDAENSRAAQNKLKADGIYVVHLKNKKGSGTKQSKKSAIQNKKVSVEDLSMMTRQLATLLKASIPLVDSLSAVSEQVENPVLKEAVADIKNMVNEGASFHKSLLKYPKIFDKIYISMCEAGEMSGTLDAILIRLAEFTESQSALRSKIKSAMLYPVIMMFVTLGLLGFLFVYLIPKMVVVFESAPELVLPWYTQAIINASDFMVAYWHVILIIVVGALFTFNNWKKTPNGRVQWDRISLRLPVLGSLTRTVAVSRFTRTLSTLLEGGVDMLSSMAIVRNVVDNEIIAKAIDEARDNISEGESIAGPLKRSEQFPPLVIHMINIGEKTGELENMLTQVSDAYDFQVKNKVEGLTSILEPVMIVVMGGVIGIIVLSIMVPMFQMTNLAG